MDPLATRNTDLMKKDLVQMLRGSRASNSRYAVVDSNRRMTHTPPPTAKLPKAKGEWFRKGRGQSAGGAKLGKIFG
jgi:hypothetical protein